MRRYNITVWIALLLCVLTGCDNLSKEEILQSGEPEENGLKITHVYFSPDYKDIYVDLDFAADLNGKFDSDSSAIVIDARDFVTGTNPDDKDRSGVRISRIENVVEQEIRKEKLKIVALVDLTLPQPMVDDEMSALREMKNIYISDMLYVSFMYDRKSTEILPLTDYVLNNYFVSHEDSEKYLFRSIVEKRDEMLNNDSTFLPTDNLALVVFSDGEVYNADSQPIDPNYYEYKAELDQVYEQLVSDTLSIYYVSMDQQAEDDNYEAINTLRRMCKNYDGLYQEQFNWTEMEGDIKRAFNLHYCDYRLTLTNPDNKLYRGRSHTIAVNLYDREGNLLGSDTTDYSIGSVFDPIVVNGRNTLQVVLQGTLLTILMLLIVYLVMQFLVPYILYRIFCKKYVVEYTGKGMSVKGKLVTDTCYLCKDTFKEGELVVAKCEHTIHKSCWDENEYRCPEFGRRCHDGSHYYNHVRPTDPRNAYKYMRIVLTSCIAAFVAWAAFMPDMNFISHDTIEHFLSPMLNGDGLTDNAAEHSIFYYTDQLNVLAYFGICIGAFNTLFFSLLLVANFSPWRRAMSIALRTLLAAICCSFFFATECIISFALNITSYSFLIDWIPWTLSSMTILYLCSYNTGEKVKKQSVIISCIAGMVSMNIWDFILVDTTMDYRLMLLISFIVYSATIAICLPNVTHRSDYYFLSVTGAVKPMDIALYKWFRTEPNGIITIGKSVDCNLQISWELSIPVAPIQAEIRMRKGVLRLYAIEDGVTVGGKPWPLNKGLRLYHGTSFTIGKTTFTYKEKDIYRG